MNIHFFRKIMGMTAAGQVVDKDQAQTITGVKTFSGGVVVSGSAAFSGSTFQLSGTSDANVTRPVVLSSTSRALLEFNANQTQTNAAGSTDYYLKVRVGTNVVTINAKGA